MNVAKMMRELQDMQARLKARVEAIEVEASAGGGLVVARMDGKKTLTHLEIKPEAVSPDDLELMGDLIRAAVNEAGRRVDEEVEKLTEGLAAGLKLPVRF